MGYLKVCPHDDYIWIHHAKNHMGVKQALHATVTHEVSQQLHINSN